MSGLIARCMQSDPRPLFARRTAEAADRTLPCPRRRFSLLDVGEAVKEPVQLNQGIKEGPSCGRKSRSPPDQVWSEPQAAIPKVLGCACRWRPGGLRKRDRAMSCTTRHSGFQEYPGNSAKTRTRELSPRLVKKTHFRNLLVTAGDNWGRSFTGSAARPISHV